MEMGYYPGGKDRVGTCPGGGEPEGESRGGGGGGGGKPPRPYYVLYRFADVHYFFI